MDMNGGQLSMQGIDILRTMETNGNRYSRNSIFPAVATIKRTCTIIDNHVRSILPFELGILPEGGEYAKFNPKDVVRLMIKGYKLEEESVRRSIKINQAIDGAQITTRTHHTTIGFKMADKAARDPRTGDFIYANENKTSLQSKNHCFPTMIVMKRETTDLYQHFTTVMQEMNDFTKENNARELLGFRPIIAPLDSDMSATWKLCGRGGATKKKKHPCHICAVHDEELEIHNLYQCTKWCREFNRGSEFRCYHKDFLHEEALNNLRTRFCQYAEEIAKPISEIQKVQAMSSLKQEEDPRGVRNDIQYSDPNSIFL